MDVKAKPHERFPWDRLMHAGLCLLRLQPQQFWALTPNELSAMTGGFAPRPDMIGREALGSLMTLFPDGPDAHDSRRR